MKKLLLFMAGLSVISSCRLKNTEKQFENQTKSDLIYARTLNNIDELTAGKMIQHFYDLRNQDKAPLATTFYISKDMLHKIVRLLEKERAEQKAQQSAGLTDTLRGITDGVRMYFASELETSTPPLDNTILLVSTQDGGKVSAGILNSKTGRVHKDYYQHASDDSLFMLRNYETPCIGSGCPGARLYGTNPTTPNCGTPHGIPVSVAEKMISNFLIPHQINTIGEWFDLEFLEALDKSTILNGIRIYYAKHISSVDIATSQRNTFIITTTKRDPKSGLTIDYFECEPVLKKYLDNYRANYRGDPQDNGELCPDNCDK